MTPTSLFTLFFLIVLYALAWHDRSAHQPSNGQLRAQQTTGAPHTHKEKKETV